MQVQCIDLPRIQRQQPARQLRPMNSIFLLYVYGKSVLNVDLPIGLILLFTFDMLKWRELEATMFAETGFCIKIAQFIIGYKNIIICEWAT